MDPYLRELGVKAKLDGGKFYLLEDYVVCKEGKAVTTEQVKVMRLLGLRIDEFKIKIQAYCTKEGEIEIVDSKGFEDDYEKNEDGMIELN